MAMVIRTLGTLLRNFNEARLPNFKLVKRFLELSWSRVARLGSVVKSLFTTRLYFGHGKSCKTPDMTFKLKKVLTQTS